MYLGAHGEIAQLVASVKHMVPDGEIDEGGYKDTGPDGHVVGVDSEVIVFISNPAPELSYSIVSEINIMVSDRVGLGWGTTHRGVSIYRNPVGSIQQTDKSRQRGHPEGDQVIYPHVFHQGVGVEVQEKDHEDVDGHGERPPRVRLHEPVIVRK